MNRLVKYENPVSAFMKLWDPFGSFMTGPGYQHPSGYLQESISKDADGYTIQLVVPGIPKDDLVVEFKGDILQINRKEEYLRSYRLPQDADSGSISAELSNGILSLRVPIKKAPVIKIEVKQG